VSDSFRILVVCSGNICRSPAAELILERMLPAAGVDIESAGTRAMTGRGVAAPLLELLAERGIDGSGHRARQVTRAMVQQADLVLTATRGHRSEVATMAPTALPRVFTLADFGAALAATDVRRAEPVDALREALRSSAAGPRAIRAADPDILDPYGRSVRVYRESLRQLDAALEPFAALGVS
jgi:protein-tyrosine phosphatase